MSAEDRVREQLEQSVRGIDPDAGAALERVSHRGRRRRRIAGMLKVSVAAGLVVLIAVTVPKIITFERTPQRPATSPSVSASAKIAGTYGATIAPAPGAVTGEHMAGTWTLRLAPDGSVGLKSPPGFLGATSGTVYRLVGGQFQTNAFANDLCPMRAPGTYLWNKGGSLLHFTLVRDPCHVRALLFTDRPWHEQP
jgi:hypothetical protein